MPTHESTGQTLKRLRLQRAKESANLRKRRWRKESGLAGTALAEGKIIPAGEFMGSQIEPSEAAKFDRERRAQLSPISLTAALLGDPLPGRSALDKRKPRLIVNNREN